MRATVFSPRERAIWALAFVIIASAIVVTRFTSTDPDSGLYAAIAGKLADTPVARWLSPEWWGLWPEAGLTGLFLEHPAGVFLLPAALQRAGIPAEQGAYVVGVGAGLVALLLLGVLVRRLAPRDDARAVLVLLQLMPVAFIFRIRTNHEYLMLCCLFATLVGLDDVKRSWSAVALVVAGLVGGLLVKGVFVAPVVLAAGLWILTNPTRSPGSAARQWAAGAVGVAAMIGAALIYDAIYRNATGVNFWGPYWDRQMGPVKVASAVDDARVVIGHLGFYALRLLWHPAPWSLALIWAVWRSSRARGSETVTATERHALWFVAAFVTLAVLLLSLPSRYAERYVFSATYLVGATGVVAACRVWPVLSQTLKQLDAAIPAFPVVVWFSLMVLRLALGPFLPRV